MSTPLELTEFNVQTLVDQPTLVVYLNNGIDTMLESNRSFYKGSKELNISGIYFAMTTFKEGEGDFTVLSLYKKHPRQKKTYKYAFGAYDEAENKLVWFFNAQSFASNRDTAVKTHKALSDWCKQHKPHLTPFAFKK